jgi:hypothetical protein
MQPSERTDLTQSLAKLKRYLRESQLANLPTREIETKIWQVKEALRNNSTVNLFSNDDDEVQ